jgi:hypothetical protein
MKSPISLLTVCCALVACKPSGTPSEVPSASQSQPAPVPGSGSKANPSVEQMPDAPPESLVKIIKVARTGEASVASIAALKQLLEQWDPVGRTPAEIEAAVGVPNESDSRKLLYRFDPGYMHHVWTFSVEAGKIKSVSLEVQ